MNKQAYDENGKTTRYESLQDNQSVYRHSIETFAYTADDLSSTSYKKDTLIWKDDESKDISYTSSDYKYNEIGQAVSSETFNIDPETNRRVAKVASSETAYDSKYRTVSLIQNYYDNGILSSGYKSQYDYIDDNDNYTQMEYSWSKDAGGWVQTYGYRYAYERDGENLTQIDAYYDTDNNQWYVNYSYKKEVTEENPKVCKIYFLPENDIENWEFMGSDYYYYSESTVANEAIQTVDSRIYTRPGTIHIDMEGVADLWIYTANGACCYHSKVSGSTDVSNLQGGIYFVVLQSESGVKKAKVLVK